MGKTKTKPKRRGRPAPVEPLTAHIHIKITEAQYEQLKADAVAQRRTIAEIVRARVFTNGGSL